MKQNMIENETAQAGFIGRCPAKGCPCVMRIDVPVKAETKTRILFWVPGSGVPAVTENYTATRPAFHPYNYKGGAHPAYANRLEALIGTTAHELFHLSQWFENARRQFDRCEMGTCWASDRLLESFRANRESLLAAWTEAPSAGLASPKPTIIQRRAIKAAADLGRWQRKLKLAQGKVRKLRARVAYYERKP